MAASYPTSAKSFSTKSTLDVVEASHINDLQDEVTAIETALVTGGIAHALFPSTSGTRDLGTSSLLFRTAYLDTALILGAATTSGIRLDLETGVLAVREGDDSAYAALKALTLEATSNGTIGGTLGVTGATTLAALSATTGAFSGDVRIRSAAASQGIVGIKPGSNATQLWIEQDNTADGWKTFVDSNDGGYKLYRRQSSSDTLRATLTAVGNLLLGGTASRASTVGTNHLDIFDGTAPVGTLANGISLYSTSGELRVMDAAGNATLLSPHDQATNRWIYDSVDTRTGKSLRIEMELLMRRLNEMCGGGFIEETA